MRAFITHGGISSTQEAVNCGIPLIIIPQFGDQFFNAELIKKKGFGVTMFLNEATKDKIIENVKIVLSNE